MKRWVLGIKTPEEREEERALTSHLAGRLQAATFTLGSPTHISEVVPTLADGAVYFVQVDGKVLAVVVHVQDNEGPIMRA